MEDMSNLYSNLSINITYPEYILRRKITVTSRFINKNILLANPNLNFDLNLGTEIVVLQEKQKSKKNCQTDGK